LSSIPSELYIHAHYIKIIPLRYRHLEEDTLQQCFLFPFSSDINIRIEYVDLPHDIIQGMDKIMETLDNIYRNKIVCVGCTEITLVMSIFHYSFVCL